ncbi:hypothetical protein EV356DRAFT_528771 [Viridothelium virens]|uniref:SnoaL-like domain-containing protein n=1 Tax=Viridothelium virens TaxID=1048519 RepID=A0A6A6HM50_VIRVR|nr:hypothetical protein EV356DRAFT_528771 [Viridothelium virens]
MAFVLTPEYILHFLNEAAAGDPGPFAEALDPEVRWRIGSEVQDDIAKTGMFNRQGWMEQVYGPLQSKLKDGKLNLIPLEVEVVQNKAYVEFKGEGTQNNGRPYNNQYLWVMIFDDNGKATEIREYLDTGLVREVFSNN